MELVKLGKKGQVTIPKSILRSIGIPDEAPLLVETTPDGAIVLRQAAVYPIELYTEEQLAEYEESNTVPPALERRVEALAARRNTPRLAAEDHGDAEHRLAAGEQHLDGVAMLLRERRGGDGGLKAEGMGDRG